MNETPQQGAQSALGGVKSSGFGRLNGRDGLRAFTNAKAVLTDRFGALPAKLYPVGPDDYELTRDALRTLYRPGVASKAGALWSLLGTLRRQLSRGR